MSRMPFLLALTMLALHPIALAHGGGSGIPGSPDTTCEVGAEWADHDYGPATGLFIRGFQDSNLEDCDGDTVPKDYDEHSEYAVGGAWLLVESGDGVSSGSIACFGEVGHHPRHGPVYIEDLFLGTTIIAFLTADTVNNAGPNPITGVDCGDFESDYAALCQDSWGTNPCTATFPPGIDGSYHVLVSSPPEYDFPGTPSIQGHICTPGACSSEFWDECLDGNDNDGDGGTDWIALLGGASSPDPECDDGVAGTGIRDPDGES